MAYLYFCLFCPFTFKLCCTILLNHVGFKRKPPNQKQFALPVILRCFLYVIYVIQGNPRKTLQRALSLWCKHSKLALQPVTFRVYLFYRHVFHIN